MSNTTLAALSNELGTLAEAGAASVVQVLGARRPASGVVHGPDTIITAARAIGREDGLRVRGPGGESVDADLAGWDPATGIAVLHSGTRIHPMAGELRPQFCVRRDLLEQPPPAGPSPSTLRRCRCLARHDPLSQRHAPRPPDQHRLQRQSQPQQQLSPRGRASHAVEPQHLDVRGKDRDEEQDQAQPGRTTGVRVTWPA